MSDPLPPQFGCALCDSPTMGNTRSDEGAMLCRSCHLDFISATGDTLEEQVQSLGYSAARAVELAGDMRALFAIRHDGEALARETKRIEAREAHAEAW